MPILGAHMSVAGGFHKAVERGVAAGAECIQIFTGNPNRWSVTQVKPQSQSGGDLTKNNNQWRAKPITDEDATKFRDALAQYEITDPLSHASYLINLASPKDDLRQKSIEAMVVELQRANTLGIPHVVFHPGSYTTSSEAEGLDAIVNSLDQIHEATESLASIPLLENTAGQGSNLGWQFEHLAYIISNAKQSDRLGVCIDTCHTFAAGYPLGTEAELEETVSAMDRTFGLSKIKAIHLNDSKKEFGSQKDRHEHIGEGEMGLEPFRLLLNDPRFEQIPMYLETEKGDRDGEDFDVMNLKTLRHLLK